LFSFGLIVVDVFYIYLTLRAMQWIQSKKQLFKALEWVTLAIVFSLAASNFYAALHPSVHKNVLLSNSLPRFVLGFLMNALNPLQIPFWFGWTTVLFSKKILQPRWKHYHLFVAGASIGFFAALLIFIFGGRLIAEKISSHQSIVYLVIGGIFVATGLVQIWKMTKKKDADVLIQNPDEIELPSRGILDDLSQSEDA
jgi:threonine/homoserine/homoserine lactone efflux protein